MGGVEMGSSVKADKIATSSVDTITQAHIMHARTNACGPSGSNAPRDLIIWWPTSSIFFSSR